MRTKPTTYAREKVKPGIWRRRSPKTGEWVYEIAYRDSDARQRRQRVTGGLKEAETALSGVKAEMGKGKRVAPNHRLTFAAASAEWFDVKAPNLTSRTIDAYRYALDKHLLPAFGRKRLSDIDVSAVARFVAKMATAEYRRSVQRHLKRPANASTGYSVQTIKSVLIPLSRTFAYARRHLDFPGENPVTALDNDERPGYRKFAEAKPTLNRDQLDKLIEGATSPWREIIAAAIALGTRLGETIGLEWRHVDLDAGTVRIDQQVNRYREVSRVKTRAGVRVIEAPDWLIVMLRAVKLRSRYCGPDDLVFPTLTGKPHGNGNVLRGLYAACRRAGLSRTSFHSLRHTHASLWIKEGGDVVTLSRRLGHANPQITMMVYAHEIEEANDKAARRAKANELFAGTKLAAFLAAPMGDRRRQKATATPPANAPKPNGGGALRQAA